MKFKLSVLFVFAALLSFGQVTKNQEWNFEKKVTFDDSVRITTGATNGYVLTSDGRGIATWQASGSGAVQSVTVTLDSTDIVSMHTTPITIVAAQGANTLIVPIRITGYIDFNSTAYATDVQTRICIDPNGVLAVFGTLTVIGSSSDIVQTISGTTLSTSGSISTIFNSPLVAFAPASNPTAGNSTLTITVLYQVVNL